MEENEFEKLQENIEEKLNDLKESVKQLEKYTKLIKRVENINI